MSFGEPEDVDGECNARCYVADDFGDNHATFRCHLTPGHEDDHEEIFRGGAAKLTWRDDEREHG